jgi:hypothetical protein
MILYKVVWLHFDHSRVDSLVHNGAVYLCSFTTKPVDAEVVGMLFGVV